MDDDKIIADGLLMIRDGILKNDLQLICNGYNYITDEDLKPASSSRKEKIKALMRVNDTEVKTPKTKDKKSKKKKVKNQEEDENFDDIVVVEQKGGKKFGQGNIQVISDPYNVDIANDNKKRIVRKNKRSPFDPANIKKPDFTKPGL